MFRARSQAFAACTTAGPALAQAIELEVASQREAMVSHSDFVDLRGEFRSELTPLKADVVELKADVVQLYTSRCTA